MSVEVAADPVKTPPELDKLPGEGVASVDDVMDATKDEPCDIPSVPAEVPTESLKTLPEVDNKSSDEVKMSVEATKDEPINLALVPSGDDVSPEVVPSQEKLPEKASDPKNSCKSPALVSAVEDATGVPKKELSEDEVSPLIMVIDALRSKIESFTAAGQFQSVDDVLNDVRELREQVQEGERTVEGKLKEVKSENDLLKLKAQELQEKFNDKEMELKVFKLGFKDENRSKEAAEKELSQLKVQLEAKDEVIFETRTTVSGLVDIIEGLEGTQAIYLEQFRTAGEAMLKAMVVAGSFLPPKKSVLEDLKKVSAATGVLMPYVDLHELCEGVFFSANLRLPEEPKQGTSKQAKLVHSKRAESVGSGSTTEPTKFSRTHAPRKGPKSKTRSGRPKSRIAVVSSRESSESDRQVPESPDDFQRKEPKKGGVGVRGGGRRRARSTSSTKSTDPIEDAMKKLKKGKGSEVPPKKRIKVEEEGDADVENSVDADVQNPLDADVQNPVDADVQNPVDADVEIPVEAESKFTKDGLYDKRQIVLELQSDRFLCGVCYKDYTSRHTWLRHACKHDLHFIQFREVVRYGEDRKGKAVSQSVKKGFCKYCNTEADAFPPEQKYYDLYNKDALKCGLKSWIADEKARGDVTYVNKLKKTK